MKALLDKILGYFRGGRRSSLAIIIIAALLVELISIFQYSHLRKMVQEELEQFTRAELRSKKSIIHKTLFSAESTLKEHQWYLRRYLSSPDSIFKATGRLIESNSNIVGGCIAYIPDYLPGKKGLYETYASKDASGEVSVIDLASTGHDYTVNPYFRKVVEEGEPFWSDPYLYGPDSLSLSTYSYPMRDMEGRLAAVCGLDIDMSWLGDTLNARNFHPSSYCFMLTSDGRLAARPPEDEASKEDIEMAMRQFNDSTAVRQSGRDGRNWMIRFKDSSRHGRKAYLFYTVLETPPYWQVVQVCYRDEIYAPLRRLSLRMMLMVLAGLLILFFMIERFARNERKLQTANVEKARIGSELSVAKRIQSSMLPKTFPPFPERKDIDIYGLVDPAREVGGDLFDFFIRDGKLFFCIGDVSGKGIPSAMVMSVTSVIFRMVSSHEDSPARIAQELNTVGSRDNETNMFVTFFIGVLDLSSGRLRYCSAGHDSPMLVKDGVSLMPCKPNLPLAIFEDTVFEEQETVLENGTTVFLYTDGITEARDADRKLFTRQRLQESLGKCLGMDCRQMVEKVFSDVQEYSEGAVQSDDITMLAVRYIPDNQEDTFNDSITLNSDRSQIEALAGFVKSVTGRAHADRITASRIRLALEEIVVNIMSYAYPEGETGDITVEASADPGGICFTVTDSGVEFDPTGVAPPDTSLDADDRPVGGLGIHISRSVMDSVSYERADGKNVLTLKKSLI